MTWRWPWVSRELLDVMRTAHAAEVAALQEALTIERARVAAYSAPKPEPKLAERSRDAVIDAILQRAASDGRLVRHLSAWAMKERATGTDDDTIIDRILHWHAVSDEVGIP
jgi:hypothetical protein